MKSRADSLTHRIEPQVREETGAFDPCATWTQASLRTLLRQPDSAVVSMVPSKTACTYTVYFSRPSRNVATVGVSFIAAEPGSIDFYKGKGWSDVAGARFPTLSLTTTDQYGVNAQRVAFMHGANVFVSIGDKDGGLESAVAALSENLAQRAVP